MCCRCTGLIIILSEDFVCMYYFGCILTVISFCLMFLSIFILFFAVCIIVLSKYHLIVLTVFSLFFLHVCLFSGGVFCI